MNAQRGRRICCRRRRAGRSFVLYRSETGEYALGIYTADEASVAEGITTKKEDATALFWRLVRGGVSPCHLQDVLEDFLSFAE